MAKKTAKPALPMINPMGKPGMNKPMMPPTAGGAFGPPMAKGPVAGPAGPSKPNPFAKKKGK